MSYIMMQQITTEKRDILMSIQGTNIWSGQKLQSHNSAVSFEPAVIAFWSNRLFLGRELGWSGEIHVRNWHDVSMGFDRLLAWVYLAVTILVTAQLRAGHEETAARLLERNHHPGLHAAALAWRDEWIHVSLFSWTALSVLLEGIQVSSSRQEHNGGGASWLIIAQDELVCQVQLSSERRP
jgi:hypothetical protein